MQPTRRATTVCARSTCAWLGLARAVNLRCVRWLRRDLKSAPSATSRRFRTTVAVRRSAAESEMALEMRTECERCHAPLTADGEAFICSYECTFCGACKTAMQGACKNCGGELTARPRRLVECTNCSVPEASTASQAIAK